MSESTSADTPLLDLLARMTTDSLDTSSLDEQTLMLVRIAALVASGAPAASYALNLAAAGEVGLDAEDVRGVPTAIAPIVGTSRVVAATGRIAVAIGVAIEVSGPSSTTASDRRLLRCRPTLRTTARLARPRATTPDTRLAAGTSGH